MADILGTAGLDIGAFENATRQMGASMTKLTGIAGKTGGAFAGMQRSLSRIALPVNALFAAYQLVKEMYDLGKELAKNSEYGKAFEARMKGMSNQTAKLKKDTDELIPSLEKWQDEIEQLGSEMEGGEFAKKRTQEAQELEKDLQKIRLSSLSDTIKEELTMEREALNKRRLENIAADEKEKQDREAKQQSEQAERDRRQSFDIEENADQAYAQDLEKRVDEAMLSPKERREKRMKQKAREKVGRRLYAGDMKAGAMDAYRQAETARANKDTPQQTQTIQAGVIIAQEIRRN